MTPLAFDLDPIASEHRFRARLALLHRIRRHLDALTLNVPISLAGQTLMLDLLKAANDRRGSASTADEATEWLAEQWLEQLAEAIPGDDVKDPHASYLRTKLPEVREALSACGDDNPLDTLFTKICHEAEQAYRIGHERAYRDGHAGAGGGRPSARWVEPDLRIQQVQEHPGRGKDPFAVEGRARREGHTRRGAPVEIAVQIESFGPETYAVMPYVMAHEIVCHAAAGHEGLDLSSTFAEGMMDRVVWHFLEKWLERIDDELKDSAVALSRQLRDVLARRSSSSAVRLVGIDAADWLHRWFVRAEHLDLCADEAWVHVANLALALNVTDHALDLKDLFVTQLNGKASPELADSLTRWVKCEISADELLRNVVVSPR